MNLGTPSSLIGKPKQHEITLIEIIRYTISDIKYSFFMELIDAHRRVELRVGAYAETIVQGDRDVIGPGFEAESVLEEERSVISPHLLHSIGEVRVHRDCTAGGRGGGGGGSSGSSGGGGGWGVREDVLAGVGGGGGGGDCDA